MNSEYESAFRISDNDGFAEYSNSSNYDDKIVLVDANTLREITIDVEMDEKWRRLVINNRGWHWEEPGLAYWHSQEYLQIRAAYIHSKRRRKIQAKQKRAAFRRLKKGK